MRSSLAISLISIIFLIVSMDTVADNPTQFGEIVYLQVNDDDTRQIVYRSAEVVHRYLLESDECYHVSYSGLENQLLNEYLIIAEIGETLKVINMVLNYTVLEMDWNNDWDVNNIEGRCFIDWDGDNLSIRSISSGETSLISLGGQTVATINAEFLSLNECRIGYIRCEQFYETVKTIFPNFEDDSTDYVISRNGRYIVLSACMENDEFHDDQSCRHSELQTVILDLHTRSIMSILPDSIPIFRLYSNIRGYDVLTNDNLYEFSHSSRFLSYIDSDSIVIYDLLLKEVTHQVELELNENQVIRYETNLNWSPTDERIIFSIGLSATEYPTSSVGLLDVNAGEFQIIDLEHIYNRFVWTLNGNAFIWTVSDDGATRGNQLMGYNIVEQRQAIIDTNVSWYVGR